MSEDSKPFSIGAVAYRTGLNPPRIRRWEVRYGVVDPTRTDRGHRRYSEADIQRLQLLKLVIESGPRIGEIADLSDDRLRELVTAVSVEKRTEDLKDELLRSEIFGEMMQAVERFDHAALLKQLRRAAYLLDEAEMYEGLILPFLQRIEERWEKNSTSVAREHMASTVIRAFTGGVLQVVEPLWTRTIVVATPVGEGQKFGALGAAVMSGRAGWWAVYLGTEVPPEEVADAAFRSGARCVALSLVEPREGADIEGQLRWLRSLVSEPMKIVLAGPASRMYGDLAEEIDAVQFDDLSELQRVLEDLAGQE